MVSSLFSTLSSLLATSTISDTLSTWYCRFRLSRSSRQNAGPRSKFTPVMAISDFQCLSRMAGLCSSCTRGREIAMFFTSNSSRFNTLHSRARLEWPFLSCDCMRLTSSSRSSVRISAHKVFFHMAKVVSTSITVSHTFFSERRSCSISRMLVCVDSGSSKRSSRSLMARLSFTSPISCFWHTSRFT